MKWIDLPPIWLLACTILVWFAPKTDVYFRVQSEIGSGLIVIGLGLMCWAVFEMLRHQTTVIPHQTASSLVTTGIFGFSRNPIYLGDTLLLAGLILRWEAHPLVFVLVPVFMIIITKRFIAPEEKRLKATFGDAFMAYCDTTHRWL